MGQYYTIVNVDKKQHLNPHAFSCGMKLTEWSWLNNWLTNAMTNLMAGPWKGDRVFVVGDYADGEPEAPWGEAYEEARSSSGVEFLYELGEELSTEKVDTRRNKWRYIYNHDLHQYINLDHLPISDEFTCSDGRKVFYRLHPLSLLLAMGNGRGGGDYWEGYPGYDLVGSWCSTVKSIEIAERKLPGTKDYIEFRPGFCEK